MIKSIEEQASEYATGDGGTIEKRKCFTVDLHLGNPQQYEYVKIYNNDAYCGFLAGAKARDAQWQAVVKELREALKFYAADINWNSIGHFINSRIDSTDMDNIEPFDNSYQFGGEI